MDITKIPGLDKRWQEELLNIMSLYEEKRDKLDAIDSINRLTGVGILYSSEIFTKLVSELSLNRP